MIHRRSAFPNRLAVGFAFLAGCVGAPPEGTQVQEVRTCPERVTPDDRGQPRDAAGHIRYCWPDEAACYCDPDSDCYAQDGYVPCSPASAASADSGTPAPRDAGAVDTGTPAPRDAGAVDTGTPAPRDAGAVDTGTPAPRDAGAVDTGTPAPRDAGAGGNLCPEAVTVDSGGIPRNAAGHIRNCWPGMANCYCDRDSDCYALDGYAPCTPVTAARDSGTAPVDAGTTPPDSGTAPVDAGTPGAVPADTVAYSGSFPRGSGRANARITVLGDARDVAVYAPSSRGAHPALVVLFHGTNGDGNEILDDTSAQAFADASGVVVVAPSSRWLPSGDWDHASAETYWESYPNLDVNANEDLVLTRAVVVEAQRAWGVDPTRVYAAGHSNGAFFSQFVATRLPDRFAAFASSSGGLMRCDHTLACGFAGSGTACGTLSRESGWCSCSGVERPGPIPTSGRRPAAYLAHGTADPTISVYYTCSLATRLSSLGYAVTVRLRDGDGHVIPDNFLNDAWGFMSAYRRM